jgi:hypothetical protein
LQFIGYAGGGGVSYVSSWRKSRRIKSVCQTLLWATLRRQTHFLWGSFAGLGLSLRHELAPNRNLTVGFFAPS